MTFTFEELRKAVPPHSVIAAVSVQTPFLPGVSHKEDDEQKEQWQMVEFGAEVSPHRNSRSRLPPGGEREAHHVQSSQHGRWPDPESRQQADSDKKFENDHQISEKHCIRQHQISQNRLVETYGSVLNESLKVLLESAMSKLWANNLVFA